ncbi:MAG TPA: LCP family protein, partial [Acidimicrobiia bacterium]
SDDVCGAAHGSTQRLVDTITTEFGVPIDHVVVIGFTGFSSLVDDLGGLRINFPVAERDTYTGLDVTPGCQTLSGAQALSFVRSRHVERFVSGVWHRDAPSDLERVSDEQLALRQLAAAAVARAGTDPRPLLETLFNNVTVDSAFTSNDALTLFEALRAEHDATTLTLPVVSHDAGDLAGLVLAPGAQNVLDALAGRAALSPPTGPVGATLPPIASAC